MRLSLETSAPTSPVAWAQRPQITMVINIDLTRDPDSDDQVRPLRPLSGLSSVKPPAPRALFYRVLFLVAFRRPLELSTTVFPWVFTLFISRFWQWHVQSADLYSNKTTSSPNSFPTSPIALPLHPSLSKGSRREILRMRLLGHLLHLWPMVFTLNTTTTSTSTT